MDTRPSWPLDSYEHMVEALREQDVMPQEMTELAPLLLRLTEWQAPVPSPADTQRLFTGLQGLMPHTSPVRQALVARWTHQRNAFINMLAIVRAQVSILRVSFWVSSSIITLLGALAVFGINASAQDILLRAFGPLLAYLSTVSAFRAADLQVLEFELVCPPSLLQLTIARLVIVLGYDAGLGLLLSLLLWVKGSTEVLTLTLSWLMPLLLVAGLALLLSLFMKVRTAAALAYGGWLSALMLSVSARFAGYPAPLLTVSGTILTGLVGLLLVLLTALRITKLKGRKALLWNL